MMIRRRISPFFSAMLQPAGASFGQKRLSRWYGIAVLVVVALAVGILASVAASVGAQSGTYVSHVDAGSGFVEFTAGMTIANNTPRFQGMIDPPGYVLVAIDGVQVGKNGTTDDGWWQKGWKNAALDDGDYTLTVQDQAGTTLYTAGLTIDADGDGNPTPEPTEEPTVAPTPDPTEEPTVAPTPEPTEDPTVAPTPDPTASPAPVLLQPFADAELSDGETLALDMSTHFSGDNLAYHVEVTTTHQVTGEEKTGLLNQVARNKVTGAWSGTELILTGGPATPQDLTLKITATDSGGAAVSDSFTLSLALPSEPAPTATPAPTQTPSPTATPTPLPAPTPTLTPPTEAPSSLTASGGGKSDTVTLTWGAVSSATDYEVDVGIKDGNWDDVSDNDLSSTGGAVTATIDNLPNHNHYTFRVRAKNSDGAGAWSETVDKVVGIPLLPGPFPGPGEYTADEYDQVILDKKGPCVYDSNNKCTISTDHQYSNHLPFPISDGMRRTFWSLAGCGGAMVHPSWV